VRFAPPRPPPQRSRSLEEQVKAFANITCFSQKHSHFLQKYLKSVLQELGEQYPCIVPMPVTQKIDYLEELGKARGTRDSLKTLYYHALKVNKPGNVILIAKGIHRWKEKMLSCKKSMS
jgi:hypothetical protein